jgi:uncharacterized protein
VRLIAHLILFSPIKGSLERTISVDWAVGDFILVRSIAQKTSATGLCMIPQFPIFKKLEYSDRAAVQAFTQRYAPLSDFNFTSLWAWDTEEKRQLSVLNDNLVVRFTDYISNTPFYSYLGDKMTSETAQAILDFCQRNEMDAKLKFISEDSIRSLDFQKFQWQEDRDNFDYILDNQSLAHYQGKGLRDHFSFKRRFIESCGKYLRVAVLDLTDSTVQGAILSLNETWAKNKASQQKDASSEPDEAVGIKKIFAASKDGQMFITTGVFNKDALIGYAIDEAINHDLAIRHFSKADTAFKGVYSYLFSEAASILLREGKRFVNLEQDLGLRNLRQSKRTYQPAYYLKKYTITSCCDMGDEALKAIESSGVEV